MDFNRWSPRDGIRTHYGLFTMEFAQWNPHFSRGTPVDTFQVGALPSVHLQSVHVNTIQQRLQFI